MAKMSEANQKMREQLIATFNFVAEYGPTSIATWWRQTYGDDRDDRYTVYSISDKLVEMDLIKTSEKKVSMLTHEGQYVYKGDGIEEYLKQLDKEKRQKKKDDARERFRSRFGVAMDTIALISSAISLGISLIALLT